jgi:predicted metal-dependent peptidase
MRRVSQAKMAIDQVQPYYGMILKQFETIPLVYYGGMPLNTYGATDCKSTIMINPLLTHPSVPFGLNISQLMFLLGHEVGHIAYSTKDRQFDKEPTLWNQATDFAINGEIVKVLEHGWGQKPRQLYEAIAGVCLDPKYDGMRAEEIYANLEQLKARKPDKQEPKEKKVVGVSVHSRIRTPRGLVLVTDLQKGDEVFSWDFKKDRMCVRKVKSVTQGPMPIPKDDTNGPYKYAPVTIYVSQHQGEAEVSRALSVFLANENPPKTKVALTDAVQMSQGFDLDTDVAGSLRIWCWRDPNSIKPCDAQFDLFGFGGSSFFGDIVIGKGVENDEMEAHDWSPLDMLSDLEKVVYANVSIDGSIPWNLFVEDVLIGGMPPQGGGGGGGGNQIDAPPSDDQNQGEKSDDRGEGEGGNTIQTDKGTFTGFEGGVDSHLNDPLTEEEKKKNREKVRRAIAAADAAGKGDGVPSAHREMSKEPPAPLVPWTVLFRQYLEQTLASRSEYDPSRLAKRYAAGGFAVPGLAGEDVPLVVVAVDTSGSVSDDAIMRAMTEILQICKTASDVMVIVHTNVVHEVITGIDEVERWAKNHRRSDGGTSHAAVFRYIRKKGIEPTVFIGISDMDSDVGQNSAIPTPPYPVIWIEDRKGHGGNAERPKFGKVFRIK